MEIETNKLEEEARKRREKLKNLRLQAENNSNTQNNATEELPK